MSVFAAARSQRAPCCFLSIAILLVIGCCGRDAWAASAERLSVGVALAPGVQTTSLTWPVMPTYVKALDSAAVTLTFEGLKDGESVLNFYAGGLGGSGTGPGSNYGITFSGNALACIDVEHAGSCNYVGEPSLPTQMYFVSGSAATMNVAAGFTTGFSFYYAANGAGTVVVYDGLNATGNVLATLDMPVTPASSTGFPSWVPFGVTFSGTARSVDFGGAANLFGFDNITINSSSPGAPLVLPPPTVVVRPPSGANTTHDSRRVALSRNGKIAVFQSQETDLVTSNNQMAGGQDVYMVVSGHAALENKDSSGNQLIGTSSEPAVSADGSVVAFVYSQGAVAKQAKGVETGQIFAGRSGQPKHQVDMGMGGSAPNAAASGAPSVASANGSNKLVFCSAASNLVMGDNNGARDVFLVDPTNAAQPTQLISKDNHGNQLSGDSCEPKISADGTKVAFTISAPNLYGTNARQVARKDLTTGKLEILSSAPATGAFANGDSTEPTISADGSVIAFTSRASNLDTLGAPVNGKEVFASLAQSGSDGSSRVVKRLRSGDGKVPNGLSESPQVTDDGTAVVMHTGATNFSGASQGQCGAVAITTNFFTPIVLGSSLCTGTSSNQAPAISGDGTMTGFDSNAPQPGTASHNSNAYAQSVGGSGIGVSNLSGDFSGQWFDPNQNGQGLVIDVLHPDANNTRALLLTWFVFQNGHSTWVQGAGIPQAGSGEQAGTVIVQMDSVGIFHGAGFPLDESQSTGTKWGSIKLIFTDANTGIMSWDSHYFGFTPGSMAITHFLPVGLPANDPPGAKVKSCYSGNWFNPAQSGHGFEFEVIPIPGAPSVLVADWFAFDPSGNPVWLQGSGSVNGNSATLEMQLFDGPGAQFPPNYKPAQVTHHDWGSLTVTFVDSTHASVTWNSTIAGYGSGTQPLQAIFGEGLLDRRSCQ